MHKKAKNHTFGRIETQIHVCQTDNRKSKKIPEFWNRKNNLAIIAKHFEFSKIIKNQNQ